MRPSLRRGLPYRWWASDLGTLVLLTLLLAVTAIALIGGSLDWFTL